MYEIGKVYIWQNQVGDFASLNGRETTVLAAPATHFTPYGTKHVGQLTDTLSPRGTGNQVFAERGDLRPKNPPSGEKSVYDLLNRVRECETQ